MTNKQQAETLIQSILTSVVSINTYLKNTEDVPDEVVASLRNADNAVADVLEID